MNPDSTVKSAPVGGESPKVDKPPSPQVEKFAPEASKPPSPKGVPNPTAAKSAPNSSVCAASSHDATGTSPRLEPVEFRKAPPLSP
jgi:hypothetical protein